MENCRNEINSVFKLIASIQSIESKKQSKITMPIIRCSASALYFFCFRDLSSPGEKIKNYVILKKNKFFPKQLLDMQCQTKKLTKNKIISVRMNGYKRALARNEAII
ncbi:hypothetical protein BpHYR1_027292 [Brachionus plicatilis]|uniref:Uncharacterized protein n=1 Tax=Brachionus plicatilis TaxID=10195 RepID=A0A3M7Q986_BRAPC|nr:hypothetical protein BpHYR1_027292 [Brachionus plicatilis]